MLADNLGDIRWEKVDQLGHDMERRERSRLRMMRPLEKITCSPFTSPTKREDNTTLHSPDTIPTMREDDTTLHSPDTIPTMREDDTTRHSPDTIPTMREDNTTLHSPDNIPTMREDNTPFHSPDTIPTEREDDTPLHSPDTIPTMGNRLGEKKAVGSPLHWLYSSLSGGVCGGKVKATHCLFPALLLLMTPGLLMVSGVGAMCVGSRTQRLGEVLVMCPLTEDVNQTKHSVVIRSFPYKGDAVTVFGCDWLARDPDKPDCISNYDFTLVSLGKDCVVTSVPRTLVQNDSYQCQLVPQDKDQPFTKCLVFQSDDAEDPPTTISAVTPSTAADQTEEEPTGANGDHPCELVAAVVALSFMVFILLLMVIFMAVLFLRLRRDQKRSYSSSSSSSDDDLILRAKRREEEEKKNEVEKQRLRTHTPVDTWGQEHVQVCVPDATCEAEGAHQATKPDSETSSTNSEHYQGSPLLGKDENPKLTMWNFDDLQRTRH